MFKPGFIFNRQLIEFVLHSCKLSLTSSTTVSRYYCYYTDKSVSYEGYETSDEMASKNSKKPKLSDSESASSASSDSASESGDSSPPRKDAKSDSKSKSKQGNDSKTSSADSSKGKSKSLRVTAESEPTWDLSSKKFLKVRDFKGKIYVDIREFYEKNGEVLPGKKGISLTVEQWQNVCSSIDEVNQVLKK